MLPIYALRITDDTYGVNVISVVSDPAIQEQCMKFSKQEKLDIKLSQNDEKQELFGPCVVPNILIYRRDPQSGSEYYVVFEKDTIEQLEKNYFKSGFNFNVSLEHSGENVPGYVFESFIKNSELGIDPKGWDVENGTWFVRMRIEDKAVWDRIKEEGLSGFSVECLLAGVEIGETFNKQEQNQESIHEQFDQEERQVEKKTWMDELLNMADQM